MLRKPESNVTIPCAECISFAICYNNSKIIKCRDLYAFLCIIDLTKPLYCRFKGYKIEAGEVILDMYGKYVHKTNYIQYSITLTKSKTKRELAIHCAEI